ncbi:glycosyltransferase [Algoriphagus machipongonensis]|uniref:Glycosyl transferase n=1 Tax=Algoriphagus machipongonensis TaxID=388413 RepID=A3HS78_9BACT|nr:glycosyltransferase [Algoriphagus machipongonensis]EAZ82696.1 glycosyl transferase [Algoriphagus machipongonensis]
MRILLVSIGTRGDVEPFLAQAELLKEDGHEIICLFPEQFRKMVEGLGYSFIGFDKRFLEMLESTSGKAVMGGGGGFKQLKGYLTLIKDSFKIQGLIVQQQRDAIQSTNPDKVLFHAKALYCYLAAMDQPDKFILLSPLPCLTHPCSEFPHIGLAKWKPISPKWNMRSYRLVNFARYLSMAKLLKPFKRKFPKVDFNRRNLLKFENEILKTIYTISPTLFPKPENWPSTAHIPGYYFRNQVKDFQVDENLESWIAQYPKVVLLTFGSMTNPKPKEHTELFLKELVKHKIPTIVNLSWGGLQRIELESDYLYYVEQIPYDWVLPKMYGMIHHGGSGTTHQAAVNGCVQMIIPHIIDQYFWNRLIAKRNLGHLGISIHKINSRDFENALVDFWTNNQYKINASKVALEMKSEAKKEEIIQLITSD